METGLQTVVETPAYLRAADAAGMTQAERLDAVLTLAETPDAGDLIKGSGGYRKVRIAGKGKGKSGAYRVITFYPGVDGVVFLLTVIAKGKAANLTQAQINALAKLAPSLKAAPDEGGARSRPGGPV